MPEALVIIDFQNDFTPGGALAVAHGDEIGPRVNELLDSGRFDLVVATRDWHPPNHGSFEAQGGPWPPHCVQGTEGAELHRAVPRERLDAVVDKGQAVDADGYSAFEVPEFDAVLRGHGIDAITFVGLATDYCVRFTALGALEAGYAVAVDRAGVRGIEVQPGDIEGAFAEIERAGGRAV